MKSHQDFPCGHSAVIGEFGECDGCPTCAMMTRLAALREVREMVDGLLDSIARVVLDANSKPEQLRADGAFAMLDTAKQNIDALIAKEEK